MKKKFEIPEMEVFFVEVKDQIMDDECKTYTCSSDNGCSFDYGCITDGKCITDGMCIPDLS